MDKMNREQAIEDVCLIARNAIDRILELEHKRNKKWVSLTGTEINHIFAANVGYPERMMQAAEALFKEKNGG